MKTYAPVTEAVLDALKTIVGAEYVLTEPEKLEQYQTDEETDPRKSQFSRSVAQQLLLTCLRRRKDDTVIRQRHLSAI